MNPPESIASAWQQQKDASRPRWTRPALQNTMGVTVRAWAEVADDGGLTLFTPHLTRNDARAFAQWILATL